ncbi:hypothetical protein SAMD00019534_083490, partial [Acytostelium subglobosum LB1]|uniref:hypothetical protein n=1 Tax=Acytostelium subglobosum LB1 TaxID=1410327 RepID=UPI000644E1D3
KILLCCIIAVVLTTMLAVQMLKTDPVLTEDEAVQIAARQHHNNNNNNNKNNKNNRNREDEVDIALDNEDEPSYYARIGQKLIKGEANEKPMTEAEQLRLNREKALRSKANDIERPILLEKVLSEVDKERAMIAVLQSKTETSKLLPQHYVAIPKLPSDYRRPKPSQDTILLLESTWKLDPLKNPFLLPKPHIFIHIAKTGGSSLGNIFKRNERRAQFFHFWAHPGVDELEHMSTKLTTIFGHIRYGLHFYYEEKRPNSLPAREDGLNPYSYMTMLREPVDRVISHYYYHRQNKRDPGHGFAMKYDLREWIERSAAANNEQARMLCGISPHEYYGKENETEICAHHHLKYTYKYIGLTEKFSESLVLLTHYAGFQAIRFTKVNSGTQRVSVADVPEDIVEEIKRRNQMDIALYNKAKEAFEMQIDAIGREFVEHQVTEFKKKIKIF